MLNEQYYSLNDNYGDSAEEILWNATGMDLNDHPDIHQAMILYAKLMCEKQRLICKLALIEQFGDNALNYEETINNGSINANEPKFNI